MEFQEKEFSKIESTLMLKGGSGSVNMGNPYVRSGIISNSKGCVIGGETSGVEVMRIDSTLGGR